MSRTAGGVGGGLPARAAPWASASARRSSRPSSLISSLGQRRRFRRAALVQVQVGERRAGGAVVRGAGEQPAQARLRVARIARPHRQIGEQAPPPTPPRPRCARRAARPRAPRQRCGRGRSRQAAAPGTPPPPAATPAPRDARSSPAPPRTAPRTPRTTARVEPGLRIVRRRGDQAIQISERRLELVARLSDRGPQQQRLGGRIRIVPPRAQRRLRPAQEPRIAAAARRGDQHPRQARRRRRGRADRRRARAAGGAAAAAGSRRRAGYLGDDLGIADLLARGPHRAGRGRRPARSPCPPRPRPARRRTTPAAARRSRAGPAVDHDRTRKMMPAPARQRLLSAVLR